MSIEAALVLVSIVVNMCIHILWSTFEIIMHLPLTLFW